MPTVSDPAKSAALGGLLSLIESGAGASTINIYETGAPDTLPFALDRAARERDALAAGFTEVTYEETRWAYQIDPDQVKALYGNFSSIQRLTPRARETLLDDLARIAREQFDGRVTRNMTTCLYQLR